MKLANLIKLAISYFFSIFGLQQLKGLVPFFISIEPVNYCNLQCPECSVGQHPTNKENKTHFDLELFTQVIDELKSRLLHVIFYFQGEPFLNKQLSIMINYAHNAKIYTSTSTNGQFLTDEIARDIVLSGLDKIIVSVDGATQDVYQKYRVGGDLIKTIKGIEYLVRNKQELNSPTPFIEMQFLVLKTNEHQMDDMRRLAKTLDVDKLNFKSAQLYDVETGSELLTTIDKYARYKQTSDTKYILKGKQANRCFRLWSGAVVNAKGEVIPCCFDKNSTHSFGSIAQNSFSENWHNKKASDFRDRILKNRKQIEICRNCTSR
jgi:radical SAM protein with 4Fe4S-binding SPASM domain